MRENGGKDKVSGGHGRSGPGYESLSGTFNAKASAVLRTTRLMALRGAVAALVFASSLSLGSAFLLNALLGGWRYTPLASFLVFWGSVFIVSIKLSRSRTLKIKAGFLMDELERVEGSGNMLSAAYEFSKGGERLGKYSPYLVGETVRLAVERLSRANPRRVFVDLARPGYTAASCLFVMLIAVETLVNPQAASGVMRQVLDPSLSFRNVHSSNIVNVSGDLTVPAGTDVVLEALNFGSREAKPVLNVSFVPGVWKNFEVEVDTLVMDGVPITAYRRKFDDVQDEFEYFFSAGETRSGISRVTLLHRPVINGVKVIQEFPEYTQAPPDTTATLAGKIVSIAGARIKMEAEVSKPVQEGCLRFTSGLSVPVSPVDSGFVVSFRVVDSDTFYFEVKDTDGLKNDKVVMHELSVERDGCPEGEVVSPPDGEMLTRTREVDLSFRAFDDFGISAVRLLYKREGKWDEFRGIELPVERRGGAWPKELESSYHWSLRDVNILPGDRILYLLEVRDNNTLTGPCVARTETRRLVVPSLSQIYAEVSREGVEQRRELDEILEKSREISTSLEKFSESLKSTRALDWSLRKQGEDILAKQNELTEQIDRAIERFSQALRKYEQNRLASVEIARKMEELRNLLEELRSTELREAIDRFRSLLGEVPEEDVMAALKDVQLDTGKLLEGLERTTELFKQLLREERMAEFEGRLEEMLGRQISIRDSTETGMTDGLSDDQRKLSDEAGALKKSLEEFARSVEDSLAAGELKDLLEEMKNAELAERMERAAEQLDSRDVEGAKCTQNGAINQMLSLYSTMGRCRKAMGLALDRELLERIEKAAIQLVDVSRKQESLAFDIMRQGASGNREKFLFRELVLKDALVGITNQLFDVAKKSFAVSSAALARLGLAIGETRKTLGQLEDEKYREAGRSAGKCCREINSAVVILLESSSSSSSSGQASEMMQQLFQQQLSISQQLEALMQQRRNRGLSMEEMASLARLAAQQRKAEELLRQIAEEARAAEELLGSIDDIAGLMKDAAKKLERGELDEELLRRQERILSRMLESQRSMKERDFKNERISRTAGEVKALLPEESLGGPEEKDIMLKAIQRAMNSGGPEEYRELIRSYFRALSKRIREKVE